MVKSCIFPGGWNANKTYFRFNYSLQRVFSKYHPKLTPTVATWRRLATWLPEGFSHFRFPPPRSIPLPTALARLPAASLVSCTDKPWQSCSRWLLCKWPEMSWKLLSQAFIIKIPKQSLLYIVWYYVLMKWIIFIANKFNFFYKWFKYNTYNYVVLRRHFQSACTLLLYYYFLTTYLN